MPDPHRQKSSYCSEGSSCVHVAATAADKVELTESADPTRAILTTTPQAFAALLRTAGRRPAGA